LEDWEDKQWGEDKSDFYNAHEKYAKDFE